MKKKESILGMAFFGPALVLLTLFLFLPMVLTLVFSFTDYFALNPDMTHFVGLENYINIFKDELFVKSFFNTVKFVLIIVPCGLGDRDKTKATLSSLGSYAFRIFIYGAILVFAATKKHINVYTVAFGLICTNLVIKAQNLLGGKNLIKKMRKED